VNVADLVAQHAVRTPRAVAIAIAGANQSIDYRSLDRAVRRAAASLRQRGIAPGDVVGLSLHTHAMHLVVSYALARIGAVQLSLPLRDSAEQRQRLAARLGARVTLGEDDLLADWLREREENLDEGFRAEGGDAGWKIALSSGTTGEPKAALRTHAMALAGFRIQQAATGLLPADRCISFLALDFYAGLTRCVDVHFAGATLVLPPPVKGRWDPFRLIARERITYLSMVPAQLPGLLRLAPAGEGPCAPRLRLLRLDAMALNEALRRDICARVTPGLFHSYGTNEAGLLAFGLGETLARFPGAVGFAAEGVTLEIVDEAGAALPPGEVGRVRARSPAMAHSYIDDPQASAAAFAAGWYYPGDLGTLSREGLLHIKGRADDLMNFDGIKIYPAEIEAALLSHPGVVEAAAFPLASRRHQQIPAAAVVLRSDCAGELLHWARERLGKHAPERILVLPSLPKNAMGKVLKRELAGAAKRRFQAKKKG